MDVRVDPRSRESHNENEAGTGAAGLGGGSRSTASALSAPLLALSQDTLPQVTWQTGDVNSDPIDRMTMLEAVEGGDVEYREKYSSRLSDTDTDMDSTVHDPDASGSDTDSDDDMSATDRSGPTASDYTAGGTVPNHSSVKLDASAANTYYNPEHTGWGTQQQAHYAAASQQAPPQPQQVNGSLGGVHATHTPSQSTAAGGMSGGSFARGEWSLLKSPPNLHKKKRRKRRKHKYSDPDLPLLEKELTRRDSATTVVTLVNIFLALAILATLAVAFVFLQAANQSPRLFAFILAWVLATAVIVLSVIGRYGSRHHKKWLVLAYGVCLVVELLGTIAVLATGHLWVDADSICMQAFAEFGNCGPDLGVPDLALCDLSKCMASIRSFFYVVFSLTTLALVLALRYPINSFIALSQYEKHINAPLPLGDKKAPHQQGLLTSIFDSSASIDDAAPLKRKPLGGNL